MKCPKCGTESSSRFCPNCGADIAEGGNQTFSNPAPEKKRVSGLSIAAFIISFFGGVGIVGVILGIIDLIKGKRENPRKKHGLAIAAIIIGTVMFFVALAAGGNKSKNKTDTKPVVNQTEAEAVTESLEETSGQETTTEPSAEETPNIALASSFTDMKVGDVGKIGNIYVGLSYVKKMSYLPTAIGKEKDIGKGNEVIMAFFDFYNHSDKDDSVNPDDITCYADGIQVDDVETNFKVRCDGVDQYYNENLACYTQMMSVQDFAVPKDWKELKFFYKSECVWVVAPDDVKKDDFKFKTLFDKIDVKRDVVPEGTTIFNDGYEVVFKGVTDYTHKSKITGNQKYIIFKYTVNNTGSTAIDYSLAGYEMSAYQNNYFLGDADYTIDKKFDDYINIYKVDSIEPGMTANIYVAFKDNDQSGDLYMVYDDGYIENKVRGTVFVDK